MGRAAAFILPRIHRGGIVLAAACAVLALFHCGLLRADSFLDEPVPDERTSLQEPGSSVNMAEQDRASGMMSGPADGSPSAHLGLAGNPGAVNIRVGRGTLGQLLGISEESGWRLGGLWIGDATGVLAGGLQGGHWGLNNLVVIDLFLDAEKEFGWTGTSFGTQYLDYTGQPTNILAGSVQGFDGLQGAPPFNRSQWYQLWWRQEWFDGKLITRVGKSVPVYDFNNVLAAVPVDDQAYNIPAVSGLIYSPIFINPTMFARLPGYYDSATGVVASWAPNEHVYMTYYTVYAYVSFVG
jgi:porin